MHAAIMLCRWFGAAGGVAEGAQALAAAQLVSTSGHMAKNYRYTPAPAMHAVGQAACCESTAQGPVNFLVGIGLP
jgi:hypothetical protein